MPKIKKCPTCGNRMKRLYERDRLGSSSKYWGYLWLCPNRHIVIIEYRKSKTVDTYELKEIAKVAST